jgi:hypothetical protein
VLLLPYPPCAGSLDPAPLKHLFADWLVEETSHFDDEGEVVEALDEVHVSTMTDSDSLVKCFMQESLREGGLSAMCRKVKRARARREQE